MTERLVPLSDSNPPIRIMTKDEWTAFWEKEYAYWLERRKQSRNKNFLDLVWTYYVTEEADGMLKIETDMKIRLEGQPEYDCPLRVIYSVWFHSEP